MDILTIMKELPNQESLSQIYRGKTVEARSVLYPLWQ